MYKMWQRANILDLVCAYSTYTQSQGWLWELTFPPNPHFASSAKCE